MKLNDTLGIGAAVLAGFIIGKDYENNDFSTTDLLMIAGLLAITYYLAIHLS